MKALSWKMGRRFRSVRGGMWRRRTGISHPLFKIRYFIAAHLFSLIGVDHGPVGPAFQIQDLIEIEYLFMVPTHDRNSFLIILFLLFFCYFKKFL